MLMGKEPVERPLMLTFKNDLEENTSKPRKAFLVCRLKPQAHGECDTGEPVLDWQRFLSLLFSDSFSCSSALHLGDLNFNIITLYKERHKK